MAHDGKRQDKMKAAGFFMRRANEAIVAADAARSEDASAAFFKSCVEQTGELMRHLTPKDTAADIERIRLALGEDEGLVAYGGSFGSAYGAAYLEGYGQHVKAMVLDGIVDHSVDMPTFITRNILSVGDAFA